jgi:hypothetical protein
MKLGQTARRAKELSIDETTNSAAMVCLSTIPSTSLLEAKNKFD